MADVKPVPEGYHSLTPYLVIDGAADAMEYYKKAFGAVELFRMEHQGKIGHAEMKIGDSPFMLADASEQFKGVKAYGGTPVSLMIYVDDVDTTYPQAIAAGGTEMKPLQDQFYGDRAGGFLRCARADSRRADGSVGRQAVGCGAEVHHRGQGGRLRRRVHHA